MKNMVLGFVLLSTLSGCYNNANVSNLQTIEATFEGNIDFNRETRIMVIGRSHGQLSQFIQTAMSKALRYRELYPSHQIVFYGSPLVSDKTSDKEILMRYGINVIKDDPNDHLSGANLLMKLESYSKIASFDFFGHSTPWGSIIEGETSPLTSKFAPEFVQRLASKFTKDAYATLNGCNSGITLAPFLSKNWRIPVSGSLTSTDFRRVHSNGEWYVNNAGEFPSGPWATINKVSYKVPVSCSSKGACLRLGAVNTPYTGIWGTHSDAGLGFYKVFCNYDVSQAECSRRMALSLLAIPSTKALDKNATLADYKTVVTDFMCPSSASPSTKNNCRAKIIESEATNNRVYNPFNGNSIKCNYKSCEITYVCDYEENGSVIQGTCGLKASPDKNSTTFLDEYYRYIEGYKYLKK